MVLVETSMFGVEEDSHTTVVVEESEVLLTLVVLYQEVGQTVVTSHIIIKITQRMVQVGQVDTSIVSVVQTVSMVSVSYTHLTLPTTNRV